MVRRCVAASAGRRHPGSALRSFSRSPEPSGDPDRLYLLWSDDLDSGFLCRRSLVQRPDFGFATHLVELARLPEFWLFPGPVCRGTRAASAPTFTGLVGCMSEPAKSKRIPRRRRRAERQTAKPTVEPAAPASALAAVDAAAPAIANTEKEETSSSRRRRSEHHRQARSVQAVEPVAGPAASTPPSPPAMPAIGPLNPDIFIYTYVLRPRALLENYQSGPAVSERMRFEQQGDT